MRLDGDAIAIEDRIAHDTTGVPEDGRSGSRCRLDPAIRFGVVTLHEIDVAKVVPATDQVDVAIVVGNGDGVVDRDGHRSTLGEFLRTWVERVRPRRRHFGTIVCDAVTTENVDRPVRGGSNGRKPTDLSRHIVNAGPTLRSRVVDIRRRQRIAVRLSGRESVETDDVAATPFPDSGHSVIGNGLR